MTQWGLDTLFNPAKRHMDEEKRRLQSTREEIGDSSGGKRIDLESGKVTISRTKPAADSDNDSDDDTELVDGAAPEPQADDEAEDEDAEKAEAEAVPAGEQMSAEAADDPDDAADPDET